MPSRRFAVCRSGTLAIRSEARARPTAVAKPPTTVTTSRSRPSASRASSIGHCASPSRETETCRPVEVARARHRRPAERMARAHDARRGGRERAPGRAARARSSARRPRSRGRRSPRAAGAASLSGLGTNRRRTRGASAPTRAISSGPKFSTKPSLVRRVKVRRSVERSGSCGGAQDRLGVLHELGHPLAQLERPRRRHQAAPGPHQQRVAGRLAQARQRAAHGGGAQPEPAGRARDAALVEQDVEGREQVEVGAGDGANPATTWRLTQRLRATHASSAMPGGGLASFPCPPRRCSRGTPGRSVGRDPRAWDGRSPPSRCRCCCRRSARASPTWPCRPSRRTSARRSARCSGSSSPTCSRSPPWS